ncbi:hypothetical protein ACZ90_19145 [Streptomyces albus subsp. albus]|nr:hypothetical protein ACZ90_19145 [Streptomyces albus subsp. albus]
MTAGLGPVNELVAVLRDFPCLNETRGRQLFLDLLRMQLGAPLPVDDGPVTQYFLLDLARSCLRSESLLSASREALATILGEEDRLKTFDMVVERLTAQPALPASATDRLRSLLEGLRVPRLNQICRESVARFQSAPVAADPCQAFEELSRMNAEPGELPPSLAFVERLAAEAPYEQARELRAWADEQAAAIGLTAKLRSLRQLVVHRAPAEPFDAYLVVRLLPQDEPGRYLLTSWRQYDPREWRPALGRSEYVTLASAERTVRQLVREAEEEWAKDARNIHLEFLLGADELNLPVHLWNRDADSELPMPLGMAYPVVVRSLERSRTRLWRRWWLSRWRLMDGEPERCRRLVVNGPDPDSAVAGDPQALLARLLADPSVVSLVLNSPPGSTAEGGYEARAAWTAGIPVVLWDRRSPRSPEVVHQLGQVPAEASGDLARLREGVTELRVTAHAVDPAQREHHPGRHVVLVWDDPTRPVEGCGQLAGPEEGGSR